MIVDSIVNFVFSIVNIILTPLDLINSVFVFNDASPIFQWLRMAMYLIPIPQLMPIVIFISLTIQLRVAIALLRTIWDILPIL